MSNYLVNTFKQKIVESEKNKMLFVIAISAIAGVLIMPHDDSIATIATKFMFPSVAAGICFGISIMAAIDLWKSSNAEKEAK